MKGTADLESVKGRSKEANMIKNIWYRIVSEFIKMFLHIKKGTQALDCLVLWVFFTERCLGFNYVKEEHFYLKE